MLATSATFECWRSIGRGDFRLCGGGGTVLDEDGLVRGVEVERVQGADEFQLSFMSLRSWLDVSSPQRLVKLPTEPWELVSVMDC